MCTHISIILDLIWYCTVLEKTAIRRGHLNEMSSCYHGSADSSEKSVSTIGAMHPKKLL